MEAAHIIYEQHSAKEIVVKTKIAHASSLPLWFLNISFSYTQQYTWRVKDEAKQKRRKQKYDRHGDMVKQNNTHTALHFKFAVHIWMGYNFLWMYWH